jgi:hypothetical protein
LLVEGFEEKPMMIIASLLLEILNSFEIEKDWVVIDLHLVLFEKPEMASIHKLQ